MIFLRLDPLKGTNSLKFWTNMKISVLRNTGKFGWVLLISLEFPQVPSSCLHIIPLEIRERNKCERECWDLFLSFSRFFINMLFPKSTLILNSTLHIPSYDLGQGTEKDCWFSFWDISFLTTDRLLGFFSRVPFH